MVYIHVHVAVQRAVINVSLPEEHGDGIGKQPGVVHTAQQCVAVVTICSTFGGGCLDNNLQQNHYNIVSVILHKYMYMHTQHMTY